MKKIFAIVVVLTMVFTFSVAAKKDDCTTIQSGELEYGSGHYLEGMPIETGYDIFGYNYQAHMFNGLYANAYLGRDGYGFAPYMGDDESYLAEYPDAEDTWMWPYRNDNLMMKWNDAWLSNKDCDGDGVLDRHYGFDSYIGSGAWITNHQSGEYVDEVTNETCEWNYFVKIVAVPEDAEAVNGTWYSADGTEIGPVIWGEFAIIQEQTEDTCTENEYYKSPLRSGLGNW